MWWVLLIKICTKPIKSFKNKTNFSKHLQAGAQCSVFSVHPLRRIKTPTPYRPRQPISPRLVKFDTVDATRPPSLSATISPSPLRAFLGTRARDRRRGIAWKKGGGGAGEREREREREEVDWRGWRRQAGCLPCRSDHSIRPAIISISDSAIKQLNGNVSPLKTSGHGLDRLRVCVCVCVCVGVCVYPICAVLCEENSCHGVCAPDSIREGQ